MFPVKYDLADFVSAEKEKRKKRRNYVVLALEGRQNAPR